ncbi:DUF4962 domain-containing protein [Candidatus Sumerlaeota bacterium]|nr:DUF4962 domain-containing protein [Candidatus Sumerlaeota bacterium]
MKTMIPNRKFILLSAMMSLYLVSFSQAHSGWDRFSVSPLEIIHPREVAISNPPFIHWQNVPGVNEYTVIIERDDFRREWITTRNFFTPDEILPCGIYTLAISVNGDKKGKYPSSSVKFKVSGDIPSLRLQLNNMTFAGDKTFYLSNAILRDIKESGGRTAKYRDQLLEYARAPQPDAIKNLKEPPLYANGKWNLEQWRKKNDACFAVRTYVPAQCLAWRITGDKTFLDNALNVVLPVCEWNPLGATSVYESDHAAQTLLYALSLSYNLLHDSLTEEQKNKILDCLRMRTEDMYGLLNPFIPKKLSQGFTNNADNNHSWFCAQGLGFGALALMEHDPRAEEWLSFAAQLFHGLYLPRGGKSGEWHEGIDYWSYALFFVFQFCDALKEGVDVNLYQHPWLQKTAFFKIYAHPPQGGYVPFGDTKRRSPIDFDKLVMMRLASMYGDPLSWSYVDAIPGEIGTGYLFDAVFWSMATKSPNETGMPNPPFAFHFEDAGWIVSNNSLFDPQKRILFAFRCGRLYGRGAHSHADQNHFIIHAGGDDLICDAGYYDYYGSPHHKKFTQTTRAHNTILVDNEGQNVLTTGADGKVIAFSVDGASLFVQGDASHPRIYGGSVNKFIRSARYENERDFIIEDDIETTGPAHISWLLHSAFPIAYNDEDHTIAIKGNHYMLKGQFNATSPVESFITEGFPVNPGVPFTNPCHLELKTKHKITLWKPRLVLQLTRIQE